MTAKAKIAKVERILLVVPIVDRVRRELERAFIHTWAETEVIRVTADDGTVGYGETIQNYTWGRVKNTDRVIGKNPFELMWDDTLGAGLQMALFDLAIVHDDGNRDRQRPLRRCEQVAQILAASSVRLIPEPAAQRDVHRRSPLGALWPKPGVTVGMGGVPRPRGFNDLFQIGEARFPP